MRFGLPVFPQCVNLEEARWVSRMGLLSLIITFLTGITALVLGMWGVYIMLLVQAYTGLYMTWIASESKIWYKEWERHTAPPPPPSVPGINLEDLVGMDVPVYRLVNKKDKEDEDDDGK